MNLVGTELRDNRAWLCCFADGDSDGRFLLGRNLTTEEERSDECPICGWDYSYHGCRWVRITQE